MYSMSGLQDDLRNSHPLQKANQVTGAVQVLEVALRGRRRGADGGIHLWRGKIVFGAVIGEEEFVLGAIEEFARVDRKLRFEHALLADKPGEICVSQCTVEQAQEEYLVWRRSEPGNKGWRNERRPGGRGFIAAGGAQNAAPLSRVDASFLRSVRHSFAALRRAIDPHHYDARPVYAVAHYSISIHRPEAVKWGHRTLAAGPRPARRFGAA